MIKRPINKQVCDTEVIDIITSGNIQQIEQVCQEFCFSDGLCVSIYPTSFVYTGGKETGAKITLLNYPRFSVENEWELKDLACRLAKTLLKELHQKSILIVESDQTTRLFYEFDR